MYRHRSESPLVALEEEGRECRIYEIAVSLLGLTGYKIFMPPCARAKHANPFSAEITIQSTLT